MATYYITGIKKETVGEHTYITEVLIHLVDDNVKRGSTMSKDDVIRLIDGRNNIYTATWNYAGSGWTRQEPVTYETRNGRRYLRTTPDNTTRDNLLHMLPLANLGL